MDAIYYQQAGILSPKGGMYGCHLLPAGWNTETPPNLQLRPESVCRLHEEQHSPSMITGSVQLVGGQTIASHTTFPRWQLHMVQGVWVADHLLPGSRTPPS